MPPKSPPYPPQAQPINPTSHRLPCNPTPSLPPELPPHRTHRNPQRPVTVPPSPKNPNKLFTGPQARTSRRIHPSIHDPPIPPHPGHDVDGLRAVVLRYRDQVQGFASRCQATATTKCSIHPRFCWKWTCLWRPCNRTTDVQQATRRLACFAACINQGSELEFSLKEESNVVSTAYLSDSFCILN